MGKQKLTFSLFLTMKLATLLVIMGLAMSCMCFMDRELQAMKAAKSKLSPKKVGAKHLMHVKLEIAKVKNQVMTALPVVRKMIHLTETKNDVVHHNLKKNLKALKKAKATHNVKGVVKVIKKIKHIKVQLHNTKAKLTMLKAQRHLVNKGRAMAHAAKKVAKKVHKVYSKVAVKNMTNICCSHKAAPKKVVVHKKLAKKAKKVHHKLKKIAHAIKIIRKTVVILTKCADQKGKAKNNEKGLQ